MNIPVETLLAKLGYQQLRLEALEAENEKLKKHLALPSQEAEDNEQQDGDENVHKVTEADPSS